MSRKLAHYTIALLSLSALTGIYLVTVDRWLRSPEVEPITHRDVPVELRSGESLADVFPESAWQRGVCKRLKTTRGMLLFQQWEQTDRNEWKLWPITLVVGRGLDAADSEAPLIIDSAEGARLEFDDSLDIMSGGAPPIRAGEIHGDVHVWRVPQPGRSPSQNSRSKETLDIQTSNLSINERKFWTTQAIRMQIGDAVIRGEDLTLEFAIGAAQVGAETDAMTMLRRMELIYLHELTMPLADKAMLSVECGGRVQYDFSHHRLRLGESVSLTHLVDRSPVDRFECTELELTLREPMNRALERRGPGDWLSEVRAAGSPAVGRLQALDCDFAADTIQFDARSGEIRAGGSRGVQLRYGSIEAQLEGLIYSFDPATPKQLGMIDARGAGKVVWTDSSMPVRDLRWSEGLLVRNDSGPEEVGPEDSARGSLLKLWIDGAIRAELAEGGAFHAEAVEGDLRFVPEGDSPSPGNHPPVIDADALSTGSVEGELLPERFTASGDVRVQAAGIDAQSESLQLFFVHRPNPAVGVNSGSGDGSDSDANSSALSRWIGQPTGEPASPDGGPQENASPRDVTPVLLRGSVIAAKLELVDSEVVGRDLSIQGGVELANRVTAAGRSMDARMTGEELRWREGSGESLVDLRGGSDGQARLELGDGYFVGPRVQVWPTANVVEIDDAGELRLPTAVMPTGAADEDDDAVAGNENATGERWRWERPPRCRWNTAMTFDGRTARMLGGVRADASVVDDRDSWDLYLTGGALQFDLQRDARLRDVQSLRDAVLEQVLVLAAEKKPVLIEALRRNLDGELQSRHLLSTDDLRFLALDEGRLVADGPGWYRGWMRKAFGQGSSNRGSSNRRDGSTRGQAASSAAQDSAVNSVTNPLTGVHLTFHDAMVGELQERSLEFHRGVRIGVRPVATWEEAFDVAEMNAIGLEESTLDCERLRVQADPIATRGAGRRSNLDRPMPWELIADGGVTFRTRNRNGLHEAVASEARYSTSKDRFTVLASASRVAKFRRIAPRGEPGLAVEFDSLVLRPEDMTVEDLQFRGRGITLGELPDTNRR